MAESLWERRDGSLWKNVEIPTTKKFISGYHRWIHGKVRNCFKRNHDRIEDTVQNVCVRLMQKDFIGRWFFKHLRDELVDRTQAESMFNRETKLRYIYALSPVVGKRAEPDSLWKVSDILEYTKFDHERFYYSIQNHTINSDMMLRLLGYPPGSYNSLKSLYKQGRIRPSEFEAHECPDEIDKIICEDGLCSVEGCNKKHFSRGFCTTHYSHHMKHTCPVCDKARASLHARGVSLADDWSKVPEVVSSLRWNDSQLRPFLRQWRGQNLIKNVPGFIVRSAKHSGPYQGVEAGLLSYATKLITNEVINDFKRISRTLDASSIVFNNGISPDSEDSESVAWEVDDDGNKLEFVIKDSLSMDCLQSVENKLDVISVVRTSDLSDDEKEVVLEVDLGESNIRDFAEKKLMSISHLHKIRSVALDKLSYAIVDDLTE